MVSGIGVTSAAPTMSVTNLPIDESLSEALAARGKTQAQIDAFFTTLSTISVYDDHKNPSAEQRADRTKPKTFWSAPYFTPSAARSTVGAEQFADHAIEVLDNADDLLDSFELQAKEFRRLQSLRKEKTDKIKDIDRTLLRTDLEEIERTSLETLRPILVVEVQRLEQQINELIALGAEGASQIGIGLRQSIANAFVLQMSRLGLTPTSEERALLASSDPNQWVRGLASLRARASTGQFGLRQAIFEAGFTTLQRDVLRSYLELRPDVATRGLSVQAVAVRPTAQTLFDQGGNLVVRNAVMQLRGVNLANNGTCGSAQSCNAVIEYTDIGARAARFLGFSTEVTAIFMPVTFEASVRVLEPDFVGSIFCNFKTGWTAQGRADIKDGAIIYDGDLANKIKYDSVDSGFGGCQFTIIEGDKDSAYFQTLTDIDEKYRALYSERQKAAKREKDGYRAHIEAELARHQQNAQTRSRGGWFSDVLGMVIGGRMLRGFGGFLLGETRDFYWHTTTLDTRNIDEITVRQSYNVRNVTATHKYAFDGYALVCYTPVAGGGSRLMKACPDSLFTEGDTEVGAGEETCPETDIFGDCRDDQP
jgi:hypothetical protein